MNNFDFWYAVNNTEIIRPPRLHLETFGATKLKYYLLCEAMDEVDKIRVREGLIEAERPAILTPLEFASQNLIGFDHQESQRYMDYLRAHQDSLRILKYGFKISKNAVNDYVISDPLPQVIDNVMREVESRGEDLSAVLLGVEEPWEVSILKLMIGVVERSAPSNVNDLKSRFLLPLSENEMQERIDREFLEASRDPSRIEGLFVFLKKHGIFDAHEDRFFALVRSAKKST